MTDYTITTDFGAKDSLPSGNAAKIIKGSEFTTEFTNIKTAVNSKADTAGDTFTGAVTFDAAVTLNADVTFDTNTMFVDVSENRVGINTTSPAQKLDVNGNIRVQGTYPKIEFVDTDNNSDFTLINGNGAFLVYDETNSSERMRIDSSGSIGIGTTSPDTLLELVGADPILTIRDSETTGANTNATLRLAESGASDTLGNYWDINHTGNGELRFVQDRDGVNNERMRINYAGNVGIGTTNPTVKLDVETQATGDVASFTGAHPSRNLLITNYTSGGDGSSYAINANSGFGELKLQTVSKDRIKIAANGDISFYEDTGTTAQLFWDASAESLGIGTDNPAQKLDVNGNIRVQGTFPKIEFVDTDSNPDFTLIGGNGSVSFYDETNSSERMRIDSSGHVIIPAGITLGTATGTYAASNTLHDYEEGTWTPELVGGDSGSVSITATNANYVKVGRMVFIQCRLTALQNSTSTAVGSLRVKGLPFTVSRKGVLSAGDIHQSTFTLAEQTTSIGGYIGTIGGYAAMVLRKGSSDSSVTASDLNTAYDSGYILLSGSYETTQ
jgi:hypothetical protein